MNTHPKLFKYYEKAVTFVEFSENHENCSNEINREDMGDIIDFYKSATEWDEYAK